LYVDFIANNMLNSNAVIYTFVRIKIASHFFCL